jgi:hypothetical protein
MASFAFRGTARELTLYPFVALTPNADGIAYKKMVELSSQFPKCFPN